MSPLRPNLYPCLRFYCGQCRWYESQVDGWDTSGRWIAIYFVRSRFMCMALEKVNNDLLSCWLAIANCLLEAPTSSDINANSFQPFTGILVSRAMKCGGILSCTWSEPSPSAHRFQGSLRVRQNCANSTRTTWALLEEVLELALQSASTNSGTGGGTARQLKIQLFSDQSFR